MELSLSDFLGAVVFFALTFMLELIPGLRALWDKVSGEWKPLTLLLLAIMIVAATLGLQCAGIDTGGPIACPVEGQWAQTIFTLILGIIAWTFSQMTFPTMQGPLGDRVKYRLPVPISETVVYEFDDDEEGDEGGYG